MFQIYDVIFVVISLGTNLVYMKPLLYFRLYFLSRKYSLALLKKV